MQDLGTLGGTDATAFLINERGQVVGASYTGSTASDYCFSGGLGYLLTTGAFLWENGKMKDLGSFGGTCTAPQDLNNQGQVVGFSTTAYDKVQHAFLWDGSIHELPNPLGGSSGALALNEAGDAVGFAGDADDTSTGHASLWKNGAMTDLGVLNGDVLAHAFSVNAIDQVVGTSFSPSSFRAFLWEKGSIVDLNTLIPANSPLYLQFPDTINDSGEIAGDGVDAFGNVHAFLLVPCGDDVACRTAAPGPAFFPARPTNQSGPLPRIPQHRPGTRRVPGTLLRGAQ
jgi:probable HAF family extracellular repeat protein